MSIFKPFLTIDVTTSPLILNKTFLFNSTSESMSSGINFFKGICVTGSLWESGSLGNSTGNPPQDKTLVYRSIKELYYSNYIYNQNGSPINTASFNPDGTITGLPYEPNYYNYLSSTLPPNRFYPTSSGDNICVISIASNLFGEYVKPGSFYLAVSGSGELSNDYVQDDYIDDYFTNLSSSILIRDDSNGNLLMNNHKVGDIIYEHGMVIITNNGMPRLSDNNFDPSSYNQLSSSVFIDEIIQSDNIICSFNSTITLYEAQYKCTIRENEFNFSQNPSLISGSSNSGIISDFATGSYFNPYVTTVGLYNNDKELLAVAKLSQPLPLSSVTDTTIMINLDL